MSHRCRRVYHIDTVSAWGDGGSYGEKSVYGLAPFDGSVYYPKGSVWVVQDRGLTEAAIMHALYILFDSLLNPFLIMLSGISAMIFC